MAGGDGKVSEVVDGLGKAGFPEGVILALLPAGTGNDLARTELSDIAVAVLIAFLAGGVVLNVLKEELPEERESRFWAFALGAALYAGLLLAV